MFTSVVEVPERVLPCCLYNICTGTRISILGFPGTPASWMCTFKNVLRRMTWPGAWLGFATACSVHMMSRGFDEEGRLNGQVVQFWVAPEKSRPCAFVRAAMTVRDCNRGRLSQCKKGSISYCKQQVKAANTAKMKGKRKRRTERRRGASSQCLLEKNGWLS